MADTPKKRTVEPDGQAIQRLRMQKGWRVEDLAKKAQCSLRTVENVESGENVYLFTLRRFAEALGVEVSTLMPGAMPPEQPKKERVLKVTIEVPTPYEEFDESKDLVNLLQALVVQRGFR
jgi:transcriptional regulator with XRE-family HTH domain